MRSSIFRFIIFLAWLLLILRKRIGLLSVPYAHIEVYGHPDSTHRLEVSNLICNLGETVDKPWTMFGDFNKILHFFEKWGGRARPEKQMNDF